MTAEASQSTPAFRTFALRALRVAIVIIVVAVIAMYVRDMDWDAIVHAATSASVPLLALSAAGNVPLIWLKARRMRLLTGDHIGTGKLMQMYVASYAADNLVMSQAGLGVRVAMLAREGVALATAVTVQVIEKVVEGIGLAIVALPLLASDDLDTALQTTLRLCLAIGGVGAMALIVFAAVRARENKVWKRISEVAAVLRDPKLSARVGALTLAAWIVEYAMVAVALASFHVDMAVLTPILVLVAVNLAALIPGLPANIGPFEMACVLALGATTVPHEVAIGFAILYHVLHTVPVTVAGVLPAFRSSI
jgi:uncharacterized membrane protein YbhN (UPF0104 family)